MTTHVGYRESTNYKDTLVPKLLIPRSGFELSHRLPRGDFLVKNIFPAHGVPVVAAALKPE